MMLALAGNTQIIEEPAFNADELYNKFAMFIDASPKTVKTYMGAVRQFIGWLKAKSIDKPIRENILEYRDELKASYKPTTVQNYITAVRLFFQWTEQESLYPNIANHVKGAKLDKNHKKDYLTSAQVARVLGAIDTNTLEGARDYAILALMFTGGLRTIEVSRANIEDLRTLGDSTALFIQGKGREEKTDYVKIMAGVESAIREYLARRGQVSPKEPLFASTSNNSRGKALSTRSVSALVKSAMVKAGYNSDRLTAHSTRHTAVTLALLNGQSLQEVQQFARHANIATTQIYAHNLDRAKNQCEATIASVLGLN